MQKTGCENDEMYYGNFGSKRMYFYIPSGKLTKKLWKITQNLYMLDANPLGPGSDQGMLRATVDQLARGTGGVLCG